MHWVTKWWELEFYNRHEQELQDNDNYFISIVVFYVFIDNWEKAKQSIVNLQVYKQYKLFVAVKF